MLGERVVVYLDETGRQRAAYDLLHGEMYDGVSEYRYDQALPPLTVFFVNDSEALKEIPEKYLIKGQEGRLAEAMFAVLAINWAYPRLINVEMLEYNAKYGLGKVEAQWKYYNQTIKPAFIAALKDGTVWTEGRKGIPVEGQKITDELPTFVVVRGRDDSMPLARGGFRPWVIASYNLSEGKFVVNIIPSAKTYREGMPITIGGELTYLRSLSPDGFGEYGSQRDFGKIITLVLLNKPRVFAAMTDPVYGARDSAIELPSRHPGLPKEYYEQVLGE